MLLNIVMTGDTELIARFDALPRVVRQVLLAKVWRLVLRLEARVKQKLSGEVLNVVTGALRRSIHSLVNENDELIEGRVVSSGDVKYARIHEFGGTTSPHDILPVKGKALAFLYQGKQVFATIVHHPGSKIPERSYLRSSLAEMREEIIQTLRAGAIEGAREAIATGGV